jgi:hypothetical protein
MTDKLVDTRLVADPEKEGIGNFAFPVHLTDPTLKPDDKLVLEVFQLAPDSSETDTLTINLQFTPILNED